MTRAGLVGYGMAGREFHAPLLARAGCEVAAVATRDPGRVAEVGAAYPGAVVVPDLQALLALDDLDVVVLASPTGVHAEQAMACVAAGVAVVVDKPLAVDALRAAAVVAAAAEAGVPLTVFQNRRYDPEFATMRELVSSGVLGELIRAELRWERWRPVPKDRWRENAAAAEGGGIMLDLHTHLLDQAVQLFGPVARVYAEVRAYTTRAEDEAFLACTHVSGMSSHIGATSLSGAAGPRLRLLGRGGTYLLAVAGQEESLLTELGNDATHHGWLLRGSERERVQAQHADPVDFYRSVAAALGSADRQAAMPVDPADAVHVLAVIDAARTSAAESRVVEVVTPAL